MADFLSTLPVSAVNDLAFSSSAGSFSTTDRTNSQIVFSFSVGLVDFGQTTITARLVGQNLNSISSSSARITDYFIAASDGSVLEFTDFDSSARLFIDALQRGANERAFALGGQGDDTFTGSDFDDQLRSYGGDDTVNSGAGSDLIRAERGNDVVNAAAGNDSVFGGQGADRIIGGDGDDSIVGAGGADRIFGGNGGDVLRAGGGADIVQGGAGSDDIRGGGGADRLVGGGGRDQIKGGGGDDAIIGGGGRDILNGGGGADTLMGGGGRDQFIFSRTDGDEIRGYKAGRDSIDLSRVAQITDFDDLTANHIQDTDAGAEIFTASGVVVLLSGVDVAALDEGDFIF